PLRRSHPMNSLVLRALIGLGLRLGAAMPAWAQSKSELVIARWSVSAETVDPALQVHNVKYYLSLMFDYLVGTTTDGQPSQAGGLASKWESSADHRRWTFHLRKGVKFHNGDEMTSEDVKFSLQRAMSKRSTTGYAGPLRALIVDIETPAPDPEETTRIARIRRGDVDVADISRERVKELEGEGFPIHMRREEAIIHAWWILGPDGRTPPTKDKRVREALNLAIDRTEIAQSIFGGYAEPASIPMGLSWSFKEIGFKVTPDMVYAYDPARAKKLLADAGLGAGFTLDVYAFQLPGFAEGKSFAEAVAGYWEKIGVKSKLIPVDYPAFRKMWVDRKAPGAVGYYNIANRD